MDCCDDVDRDQEKEKTESLKLSLAIAGSQLTLINTTAKGTTCTPTPFLFTVLKIQGAINILEGGVGGYPHLAFNCNIYSVFLSQSTVIIGHCSKFAIC